jgi:hypothetical protein
MFKFAQKHDGIATVTADRKADRLGALLEYVSIAIEKLEPAGVLPGR